MLYGVIDIGSNTVRLTVFDVDEQGRTFSTFFKLKTMVGLVSYIDPQTRLMSDQGIDRLVDVLNGYLDCARKFREFNGPFAFATAGVRNATNSQRVIQAVEDRCGIRVDLVSGSDEARLGYVGAMRQSSLKSGLQIDVGGGSTEVTTFSKGQVTHSTSIPQGSLSLFDQFVRELMPKPVELDRIADLVRRGLSDVPQFHGVKCKKASGVGGSVRAARRLRDAMAASGDPGGDLTLEQLDDIIGRVLYDPDSAARTILRVAPERAHTCIPGIAVVREVMRYFGAATLEVHDAGVREGYLQDRVLGWVK